MNEQQAKIYYQVKEWVSDDPELLSIVINAATTGCQQYARQCRQDALEWESIALAATSKRWHNDRLAFVKMKIEKVKDRANMVWDWLLEKEL